MSVFTDLVTASQRVLIRLLQQGSRTFYSLTEEEIFLLCSSRRFPTISDQITTTQLEDYFDLLSHHNSQPSTWSPQPVAWDIVSKNSRTSQDPVGDEDLPVDLLTIPSSKEYRRTHAPASRYQRVAAHKRQLNLIKHLESQRLQDTWRMPPKGPKRKAAAIGPQGGLDPTIITVKGYDLVEHVRTDEDIDILGPAPWNPSIIVLMHKWTNNLFLITDPAWEVIQSLPIPPDYKHRPWWVEPRDEELQKIRMHSPQAYIWVLMHRIQKGEFPNYTTTWETGDGAGEFDVWELDDDPYLPTGDERTWEQDLEDLTNFHGKRDWDRTAIREDFSTKMFSLIPLEELVRTHPPVSQHSQSLRNYPFLYILAYLGGIRHADKYHYTKRWAAELEKRKKKPETPRIRADSQNDSELGLDTGFGEVVASATEEFVASATGDEEDETESELSDSVYVGEVGEDDRFYWTPQDLYLHMTKGYDIQAEIAWDLISFMVKIRSDELAANGFVDVEQFINLMDWLVTDKDDQRPSEYSELAEKGFGTTNREYWRVIHPPDRDATEGYNERMDRWIERRTIEIASEAARMEYWDVGVQRVGEGAPVIPTNFKAMGHPDYSSITVEVQCDMYGMFDAKYFTRKKAVLEVDGAFAQNPTKFYGDVEDKIVSPDAPTAADFNAIAYTMPPEEEPVPEGVPAPTGAASKEPNGPAASSKRRAAASSSGRPAKTPRSSLKDTQAALQHLGGDAQAQREGSTSSAIVKKEKRKDNNVEARATPHPRHDKSTEWRVGDGDSVENLAPLNGKGQPDLADPQTKTYNVVRYIDAAKASKPPKNRHISDEDAASLYKECMAGRMTLKDLNRDYPQTFDTNGAILINRRPRGKPAVNVVNGEVVYLIAHGNRVLFGEGEWLNRADTATDGKPSQAYNLKLTKNLAYIIPCDVTPTKWIEEAVKKANSPDGQLSMLARVPASHRETFPYREELVKYPTEIDGLRVPLEYVEALKAAANAPGASIAVRDAAATVMKQRAQFPDQVPERFRDFTEEGINVDLDEFSSKMLFCGTRALRGRMAVMIQNGIEPDLSYPPPAELVARESSAPSAPAAMIDRQQLSDNSYELLHNPAKFFRQSQSAFITMRKNEASYESNYAQGVKSLEAVIANAKTQLPAATEDETVEFTAPSFARRNIGSDDTLREWMGLTGADRKPLPPGLPDFYTFNVGRETKEVIDIDAFLEGKQASEGEEEEEDSNDKAPKKIPKNATLQGDADIE